MVSRKEPVEKVDKLIELTQHNKVVWKSSETPDNLTGPDLRIELVYIAFHLNKYIRIYQKAYKSFPDEFQYTVVFEFIDTSGHSLLQFPETNNVVNLFNAVQYQNSKMSDFYKELLGK